MDKTFRPFQPDQILLVPPSLDEWLPQDHLARFIADLVDEHLDLSAFYAVYQEGCGAPPFDPRLGAGAAARLHHGRAVLSQVGGGVLGQGGVPLARRGAGAGVSGDREVP